LRVIKHDFGIMNNHWQG